ncbi:hypothetical protein BQ8794_220254 [Mesorhizobium prunaredense]|uniref:Uncharacterized protein n=1 Tax=Mesorhizobium prunaredense TaxID=1631249 RepID=A0A1R3V779_9HYPH|nr:hypothetical protein BQ8794_220254 [Mesorhizobium prunaredense]
MATQLTTLEELSALDGVGQSNLVHSPIVITAWA